MELKTIEKALFVLKCFAEGESTVSTTELAKKLGTSKANISRVLTTLKKHDFLELDAKTRRYHLGSEMAQLARAFNRAMKGNIVQVAKPFVDNLRDEVGESVHLEVLYGSKIYLAYAANGKHPVSLTITVGDQVYAHAHAGAKAIAAFSGTNEIEQFLSKKLIPLTNNTTTNPGKLNEIYREIRKSGIAYDWEEYLEEINAIASPVFNHEDIPVAAVIIVVPSYRMKKKWSSNYITHLKETANNITDKLYGTRSI